MSMNLCDTALDGIPRATVYGEAWTRVKFLAANRRSERLDFGQDNKALVITLAGPTFEDPAGQARFDFGVNPSFDQRPELFAKVRDLVEPGELEGFQRWLGAAEQVFNVPLRLGHMGSPGGAALTLREAVE